MNPLTAKIVLVLLALTLAMPESYAKRVGSGRSTGRQSQLARPSAPAAPSQAAPAQPPLQRSQPDVARQAAPPPVAPPTPPVRQASPFRGMLTGALVGLGLGSLISHAGGRDENDPNKVNNAEGASATKGTNADASTANATQDVEQAQGSPYGPILLLGILAFAVYFLMRRARRRRRY
ncbi:MAG: hypothetical protein V7642_5767 [Burkholderiales bacterium]|jgi:hypothetical protein